MKGEQERKNNNSFCDYLHSLCDVECSNVFRKNEVEADVSHEKNHDPRFSSLELCIYSVL